MNRSLAVGGQVDFTPPPVPIMTPIIAAPLPVPETVVPHGFRELVEYRCAQQGILCIPLVNRFQAGRPIFRVGNVLCYFDRQVREILFLKSKQHLIFLIFVLLRLYSFWSMVYGLL
jgi:hypothetical protein